MNNRSILLRIASVAMLLGSISAARPHEGKGMVTDEPVICGNDNAQTVDIYCEWEFDEAEEDVECILEYCYTSGGRTECDDEDDITLTRSNNMGRNADDEWTYDYNLKPGPTTAFINSLELDFELDFTATETKEADGSFSLEIKTTLECKSARAAQPSVSNGSSVRSVTGCQNLIPGWSDVDDDTCAWYEINDKPGCPVHGNKWIPYIGDFKDKSANDACCYCQLPANGNGPP